jgi:hypothetical protein
MISGAVAALVVSIFVFISLLLVVQKERRRGRRFFAAGLRAWLDGQVDRIGMWVVRGWDHFVKYIVQLNWYYSIHSVLRTMLRVIVAVYTQFENVFERNRARTKKLRAEKRQLSELNHLRQMAEHKQDTTLTPAQQRKLRKQKLEERH